LTSDIDFVQAIQRLFPRVMRYLEAEETRELTGLQVTPSQMNVILVLYFSDNLSMGELSSEMYLTESACTRLVDRLVDAHLVRRRGDRNDRRVVRVSLTSYGRQLAELVLERRNRRFGNLARKLTEEEQASLLRSLEAVLRTFRELEEERQRLREEEAR